ncbi:MAG: amino acid permease [Candidatus Bathyarchaeia archaeon]
MKDNKEEVPTLFVRKASGLTRTVSFWDALFLNIESNTFGLGIIFLISLLYLFPGGNPLLAVIIAALMVVPEALTYALVSSAMPRSGGDYVAISRIIHPALGFASSFSMVIWFFFWTGIFANWAMTMGVSVSAAIIGALTNNPMLLELSSASLDPLWIIVGGTILLIIVTILAILSTKAAFKALDILVALGILSVLLCIVLLAISGKEMFIIKFNQFAMRYTNDPNYYQTVLAKGAEIGLTSASFSWDQTIGLIPIAAWIFPYLAAQTVVGGEVRTPAKNFIRSLLSALAITAVMVFLSVWAVINCTGYDFVLSINAIYGSEAYVLPVPPYFNFLASLLTDNIVILLLIGIGFIAWSVAIPLINFIQISRWLFAFSFDRVIPEVFSRVSSRFNTPIVGILTTTIAAEISLVIYTLVGGILTTISNVLANMVTTFMVFCIAGILFPYVRKTKEIFERAPYPANVKIAKVPLVTIAGLLATISLGIISYMYAVDPIYGAANTPSIIAIIGIFVLGLVTYYVAKYYRARQGVRLDDLYNYLPPT